MNLDECDFHINGALSSQSEAEFCYRIEPLFSIYQILSVGLERADIFWRARHVEGDVWGGVSAMVYPPPESARVGRLNDSGSPCLYVSNGIQTALLETNVQEGQIVQVAGFRVLKEAILRLIVLGEYANVQKSGYMHFSGTDPGRTIRKIIEQNESKARQLIYIDKFLAHVIGDPRAKDKSYIFSRALGAFLRSRDESDGIVFPSVRDPGGFNLAVSPAPSDALLHNVACLIIKVGKKRRFGVLDYEIVSSAIRIDESSNFIWPEQYKVGDLNMYGLTKEEYDFAIGRAGDKNALRDLMSMHSAFEKKQK